MMRRGTWSYCAATSAERILSSKQKETSDAKNHAAPVPTAVLHTLYRALFKEAQRMDADPLLKVLFPIPIPMQPLIHMDHALLVPGHETFTAALRRCFRDPLLKGTPITAAFEILNRARYHNNEVPPRLVESAKEREAFIASLRAAAPPAGTFYANLSTRSDRGKSNSSSGATSKKAMPSYRAENLHQVPIKLIPIRNEVTRRNLMPLAPGTGLIAHPLSSSHGDRRVMMVTEQTPMTTTALVLDMVYAYPMSGGNPMFPEVFWGHEVHNGGFLHVDFTMPPTAHVAVLHNLAPPAPPLLEKIQRDHGSTYHHAWTKWMRLQGSKMAGGTVPAPNVVEHHELLCKPLIRGATRADGTCEPTLYYSKVEALPYLAHLAAGQPRSSLRIYWGCMQWPTSQINNEIANGHWMPVDLSPNFFSGYPLMPSKVRSPPSSASQVDGEAEDAAHGVPPEERFPTFEELTAAKSLRMKHFDIDVVAPQVFPPDQPICKREPLWDQILLSLGGEFTHLIGAANPFSKTRGPPRYPPSEIISSEDLPDPAHLPLLLESDDDDDDDD